ncbi:MULTISPECIES: HdeD family acid-resistance protein [Roseobacteraceae]|uniref:HdeD family acid-resistance protein n=1 Tax=Roseobacteraceae TaxID=2854170 RepID=UPI0013B602F7|nr:MULTISPECIES: DUF308 domain-containing protein [Roseobacteraceae]MCA0993950.1 DUF308 domain-containing protein [Alloyangia pacifica]NDW00741.1 hypothetical protein [Salipiger sp. PrR002]NDW58410.1 hypothetical protein [Salipiger sp. PrR004]
MSHWLWWIVIGIASILGGIIALLNPFAASVTAQTLVAWFLLILGVIQAISIFRVTRMRERLVAILLTIIYLWLGISFLANPLEGLISLTLVAAIMFLVSGITKVIYAFSVTDSRFKLAMIISGAVSVILAIMIFTNFPSSAAVVLGVLLSVELLSTGVALVIFGLVLKAHPELRKKPV